MICVYTIDMNISKAHLQAVTDEDGELIAVLFFNKNHEHVFYMATKASEEEIVRLYEKKEINMSSSDKQS